jgi:hypothetical protein
MDRIHQQLSVFVIKRQNNTGTGTEKIVWLMTIRNAVVLLNKSIDRAYFFLQMSQNWIPGITLWAAPRL